MAGWNINRSLRDAMWLFPWRFDSLSSVDLFSVVDEEHSNSRGRYGVQGGANYSLGTREFSVSFRLRFDVGLLHLEGISD